MLTKNLPKQILIVALLFHSVNLLAQTDKDIKNAMAQLDTSAFKGKAFLNKAFFIKSLIDPLRTKEKDTNGNPIFTLTPRNFNLLTTIVANADLNDKPKPKSVSDIQNQTRDALTASNIISIGIINADAVLLTDTLVKQNIASKNNHQKVNTDAYDNIEIITASLLQGEVFQGNVSFRISPDLVQSNINNPIKYLEIDFQDGKGGQRYALKEQLIDHQFTSIGEVTISIKLVTKRGSYTTFSPLTIRQLERPAVFFRGTVTATKTVQETEPTKGERVMNTVSGAEYAIYLGCDGVLDKPIIIAEGFDIGQDVNIDDLVGKYYAPIYAFRNNGYDLVFVNYDDGQDYMQNNAQVLKSIINQINAQKVGNQSLTVVGESMSGLVARWALREMENQGQTHNVGHFIAFDSPNQGANVPAGLIALRRDMGNLIGWKLELVSLLMPEVRAINSSAAKQLLIYQSSSLGKDPLFNSFRQDLVNMGNGGYPNQNGIRNIALLNGSLTGNQNLNYNFGTLTPGDKILDVNIIGILCNAFLKCWTNNLNQDTKVYDGLGFGICNLFGYTNTHVTLPYNFDRLSGGYIKQGLNIASTNPNFSFVPTFSSIDYRGSLNSDNDYNFSIWNNIINSNYQVTNNSLTPFVAIYGDASYSTYSNSTHSFSNLNSNIISWNNLAYQEFGINSNAVSSGCVASLQTPDPVERVVVVPQLGCTRNPRDNGGCSFGTDNVPFPTSVCSGGKIVYITTPVPSGYPANTFDKFIRITGNNGYIYTYDAGFGNIVANFPAGTYTVSTVLRYYTTLPRYQVSSDEKSVSSTLTVLGGCRVQACDLTNGDLIMVLNDTNIPVYAYSNNGGAMWYAMLNDGTFVPQSRLIANGLDANSASCFATRVETVQNGAWNDPNTWLPNFVPRYSDDIIIKTGHRVWLMPYMGIQYCHKAEVQTGAVFDCTGTLSMDAH